MPGLLTKIVKADDRILSFILWPMLKLEEKLKMKKYYDVGDHTEPSTRQQLGAHLERWVFLFVGIFTFAMPILGIGIIAGVTLAIFIDPFIWARRAHKPMVEGKDFAVSAFVNSTCYYMFALGALGGLLL